MADPTEPDHPSQSESKFQSYLKTWQKSSAGRIIETGYLALGGTYFAYKLKNVKSFKGYNKMRSRQRLKLRILLCTGTFSKATAVHFFIKTSMFLIYKSLSSVLSLRELFLSGFVCHFLVLFSFKDIYTYFVEICKEKEARQNNQICLHHNKP